MVERYDLCDRGFDNYYIGKCPNGDFVRLSDHEAELSALKKQVEELTAERDDARRYAVEARLRENQAEDRRVSESFARAKAEAEVAALRKALEFYADVSKYPAPLTGGMGDLWADCGQIARTALEAAGGRR
jgi:septal ring factor EnvC (AmiA/AmiB activator)